MCEWNGQDSAGDDFCLLAKPSGSPGRECPSTVHVEGGRGDPYSLSLLWCGYSWISRWPRRRWLAVDFLDHHICTVVKVLVILLTYPKDAVFNE